jgi:acyl carrier protein
MEPLIQDLRTFIIDNFLFGDESGRFSFTNDDSLQQRGIVDSTGILELVCHLQAQYGINIEDAEIVPDNLDSVTKIARFVYRKQFGASERRANGFDAHDGLAHAG